MGRLLIITTFLKSVKKEKKEINKQDCTLIIISSMVFMAV